jgi:hypothetical protein
MSTFAFWLLLEKWTKWRLLEIGGEKTKVGVLIPPVSSLWIYELPVTATDSPSHSQYSLPTPALEI